MSKKTSIIYLVITIIFGVLNHFVYDLMPYPIVGIFVPVNESIFEHLKLTFFPFLLTCLLRSFSVSDKDYFFKVSASALVGIGTILILYYFINIFVTPHAFINILIFIIACLLQEYTFYKQMNSLYVNLPFGNPEGFIILLTFILAFIIFTFTPPKLELFRDPVTNTYGIYNQTILYFQSS